MKSRLGGLNLRGTIYDRSEKNGRKIRDAETSKVPFMLVLGEKGVGDGTISVRRQGAGDMGSMKPEEYAKLIGDEISKVMIY